MSLVVLVALLILAGALPDLMPGTLAIDRHPPDLWAVAVLYLAFRARGFKSVGWAVAIGLVRDSVSLDPLGTHAFVLGFVAFVFAEGRRQRGRIDGMGRVVLTFAGVLLAGWLYLVRLLPVAENAVTAGAFVDAVPIALWSAVLASGLYALFDKYHLLDELCGRRHALSS